MVANHMGLTARQTDAVSETASVWSVLLDSLCERVI